MIIVTGGAGFIGSNIVKGLNQRGLNNILVVDDLSDGNKVRNVENCDIEDYMDKDEFLRRIKQGMEFGGPSAIYHQGACSDTMETDGRFIMETNYEYSKALYHYCGEHSIPFIYASSASVYGGGEVFKESVEHEQALNAYAYSKLLFDRYVRKNSGVSKSQVVGLRYFNVYGKGEEHKGRMASVAYHFFNQYHEQGYVNLFAGRDGYADGEQRRDFVWVKDVVDVNLHFLEHPEDGGIFNVGTGRAQSFNDVATAVLNTLESATKTTQDWIAEKKIRYVPFPPALIGKYQSYTQADLTNLTMSGDYNRNFASVEEGVKHYVAELADAS
ncbi:ADP-glyceromanno-heptose 6-epimerase [Arenicella xantha]|uniref:ADP-L-glycero-D-manno-heptose-6-epimerase n=1 Tax=Arenicella xantha TaxID=644221 RepID=A0A395JI02_9GAMM|nr:ADP-glyceromanno-heptose 6-epimerase [Arenicella xantha]RBP48350.1 ADP-glyceromanno-heptose 6-epimerase precursor [Arenicella xantha]